MKLAIALATAATIALAAPASAQLFAGNNVGADYLFPDTSSVIQSEVIAAPGSADFFGQVAVAIGDSSITIGFDPGTEGFFFNPGAFNGLHFYDVDGTIADITGVTINGLTNEPGFDASRITFDANNIYVDLQNLTLDPSQVIALDVTGAVPEPATWGLMILGFGAVGGAMRRRSTKASVRFA